MSRQGLLGPPAQPGTFVSIDLPHELGVSSGNLALLTDGTVLASGYGPSGSWWTLTPDQNGDYSKGTWSAWATANRGRWANPSFVLKDGRYWEAGGEYTNSPNGNKSERNEAEIFDPATVTWSALPNDPFKGGLEDAPATLLADGMTILAGPTRYDSTIQLFDVASSTWTRAANAPSGQTCEGGSILLRDGTVLSGSHSFAVYQPERKLWAPTSPTTPALNAFAVSGELGPMLLLHDGRVLVLGANEHNGLYSPDTDTWTLARDTPDLLGHSDTAAAVEGNGHVLAVSTDASDGTGHTTLHEYAPASDTWSSVPDAPPLGSAGHVRMLALPNLTDPSGVGQIMVTGGGRKAWFYSPSRDLPANSDWRPTITSAYAAFGVLHVEGTQLSGLTTGADVGDDGKMATNYPLVYLVDTADPLSMPRFVKTFDFDQIAPRPSTVGNLSFSIAETYQGDGDRTWRVHVVTSGLEASNTVDFQVTPDRGWGLAPALLAN